MRVSDVMARPPRCCRIDAGAEAAARLMWDGDCGCVCVVDARGVLVGVVTDRDLCMAAYLQGRALRDVSLGSVATRDVLACSEDDGVEGVVGRMADRQVRRVPVVDEDRRPVGIVSVHDIVCACERDPRAPIDPSAIVRLLCRIGASRAAPCSNASYRPRALAGE